MPKFLVDASYTAQGVRGLMKDGAAGRKAAVAESLKPLGVKVEVMYWAFGEHDAVLILDGPDAVTATAVAMAVNASGLVRTRTTVLLTAEEVDQAIRKSVKYKAPGSAGKK
jgi:uncharacterized protein with GYD domain